jgi:nucleotide-binding universal stress UspA family protein
MQPTSIVAVIKSLSATTDAALTRALALANWYEADLHVVHTGASARAGGTDRTDVRGQLSARVARLAQAAGAGRVNIVPAVLSGRPVAAIADYSRTVDADLVVVGKEARRSQGFWLPGSFATAVAKAVSATTMAIPQVPRQRAPVDAPFRNIVAAIDFSEASLGALSEALALAQQSGGRLTLLHVLNGFPYESVYWGTHAVRLRRGFSAGIDRINHALRTLIPPDAMNWADINVATVTGQPGGAIVRAASDRRADLLVLGVPRRPRLEEVLAGTTVHGVVRRAATPVLLVPGPSTASLFDPMHEHDLDFTPQRALGWRPMRDPVAGREGDASWH